ncbi:hypothetical protein [Kineococcus terrestris]|uniref:hypothetical protein n=1 Tax=Kineococcus terrestris TaxID=2044856 RepID=UPI0034DACCDB
MARDGLARRAGRLPRGRGAAGHDGDLRAGARLAERAAALLAAGAAPAEAWAHAAAGPAGQSGGRAAAGAPGGPPAHAPHAVRAAWLLAQRCGAAPAAVLEVCAAGLHDEADARAAVRVALSGAAVSTRTVSLLPLLGLALAAALGAPPWQVLLGSPAGLVCAAAGGALLWAGRAWSARLVRSARAW